MLEAAVVFAEREDRDRVLVIRDPQADLPLEWTARLHMSRPKDLVAESDDFLERIDNWFREQASRLWPILNEEPRRLLEKREYRTAVISAIALLESHIRSMLKRIEAKESIRHAPLSRMIRFSQELGILAPGQAGDIMQWLRIRNSAVHSQEQVHWKTARSVVERVYRLIDDTQPPNEQGND